MDWISLINEEQLASMIEQSFQKPVALFKHSTRCSISAMAKNRLESKWDINKEELPVYYLDLLRYREISNRIANDLNVQHESPQILVIRNGKCIYHASHSGIDLSSIKTALKDQ